MTLARRTLLTALAAGASAFWSGTARADAVSPDAGLVARDPLSGFAIFGFDPVSYHIDGHPRGGRAGLELQWSGAWWRFANDGNRAAFARHPALFAPAFGGFDGEAIIRGLRVLPDPAVYTLEQDGLILFRSARARDAFRAAGGPSAAARAWRELGGAL